MAVTDVGVAQGALGKTVAASILQFNKASVMAPIVNMVACAKGTNVAQVPVYSKHALSEVTTSASGAEETTGSASSITSTATSLEVFRNNVYAQVTDLAAYGNSDALLVNAGSILGNTVAAHFDEEGCALLDTFSTNTVGGAAVHMNMSLLFDAVAALEANDAPRGYSGVFHPTQMWGNWGLTAELGNVQLGNAYGLLNSAGATGEALRSAGFAATIGGVDIYTSPQVVATSDQHKGGIFSKDAISCGYIDQGGGSFIQIEMDRNAPAASTEVVANGYFNLAVTVETHGVEVHTETSTA
ncbi:MAG: hypothetical protein Unbinned2514contig1001_27 [Prokaryotic dsDNA virus sp.]|nr:MAG: hypothetical protein Unbinned2514contig1001_27 [Prokaryotic dsDNA virus sp.]|tara:strand:- start:1286 stop:2182 length:897 start_codon:yes stop_codon:yes gene_type:complete